MIWIIGIAVFAIVIFMMSRGGQKTVRQQTRDARSRGAVLQAHEQASLAADIRAKAEDNYRRIFEAAKSAENDDAVAHQIGVLQAIQAVSMPGRQPTNAEHRALQVEAAPFNKTEPGPGLRAVTEYLVWKFFPGQADEVAFATTLRAFRDEIYREAEFEQRPDEFLTAMLYSMKYDWQRWLSEHRDAADVERPGRARGVSTAGNER